MIIYNQRKIRVFWNKQVKINEGVYDFHFKQEHVIELQISSFMKLTYDFYDNRKKTMDINRYSNQTLTNINELKRQCFKCIYKCRYLYNNIVLSMLYADICPKDRRYNARPEGECIMLSNLGTYFGI